MSKTILLVDDSMTIRQMVGFVLKNAGYTVITAVDGLDGLNKAKQEHVDLIITDLNMPNKDGLTMVRDLRAETHHTRTPILMMTTESDDEKKSLGQQAGISGWMVKPFNPDSLIKTLKTLLEESAESTETAATSA